MTGLMSRSSEATPDCSCDVAYTMLATPTDVINSTSEPEEIASMSLGVAPTTMVAVVLSDAELKVPDNEAGTTECAEPEAYVAAVAESAAEAMVGADNAVYNLEAAYPNMTSPRCIRHDL